MTYIFEMTGKKNKIVVEYDHDLKLTLLAVRDESGDLPLEDFGEFETALQIDISIKKWKDLKTLPERKNKEGYVILFANGNRVKVKHTEYVRLHRIITNTTSYDIWRSLRDGVDMSEITELVPDEWLNWYHSTVAKLKQDFQKVEQAIESQWDAEFNSMSRSLAAKRINKLSMKHYLSRKLDGKPYDQLIWDSVKPELEKTF